MIKEINFSVRSEEIYRSPAYRLQNFLFFKLFDKGYRDLQGKLDYHQDFDLDMIHITYYPTRKDILFKNFERKF